MTFKLTVFDNYGKSYTTLVRDYHQIQELTYFLDILEAHYKLYVYTTNWELLETH